MDYQNNINSFGKEKNITIEMFYNFEDIVTLQQEWDNFIESVGGEIFLTYDWCRIWWEYYGKNRDLMIFIFRNNGSICGILPMFLEKICLGLSSVRIIKIVGTDFLPIAVSIPISENFLFEVTQLFFDEIKSNYKWDILYFGAICGRYPLFDKLAESLFEATDNSFIIKTQESDVQTYYKICNNWEDQLAMLKKNERKKIKRNLKELETTGISLSSRFATDTDVFYFFDSFYKMHQEHWQGKGKAGHFKAWPFSYEFHREISSIQLKYNRLRLQEICLNNNPVGYKYTYKFGDNYLAFLDARKETDQSANISFYKIAFSEQVQAAIKDKVTWIDSMRGRYNHKLELGGQLFIIKKIFIYDKRFFSFPRISLFRLLSWVLHICYYKIWRVRIIPRLNIKPGPFWKLWIKINDFSY